MPKPSCKISDAFEAKHLEMEAQRARGANAKGPADKFAWSEFKHTTRTDR